MYHWTREKEKKCHQKTGKRMPQDVFISQVSTHTALYSTGLQPTSAHSYFLQETGLQQNTAVLHLNLHLFQAFYRNYSQSSFILKGAHSWIV